MGRLPKPATSGHFEFDFISSNCGALTLMQRIIATLFLWFCSSLTYAGCDGFAEKLNAELYSENETAQNLRFSNCKVWPFDPSRTIVVLAHFQEGSSFAVPPNNTEGLYDLTVLLVESGSGKILNQLFQKSAFTSDAIAFNGISIDTAPYNLAANIRAFGVKADFANSSALNSIQYRTINLYVIQGNSLTPVLRDLVVTKKLVEQNDGDCNTSSTITNRTVAIADTTTHGYADLITNEKKIEIRNKKEDGKCRETQNVVSRNYTLRFNGESYTLPAEIQESVN